MKCCTKCNKTKDETEFCKQKSRKDGLNPWCKKCKSKEASDYRKNPKGRLTLYTKRISRLYNLTIEELRDLLDKQYGCCDICKESLLFPHSERQYHIDHDHTTGNVRSLLCRNCNIMLGHSFDNTDILLSAADYLRKHS